MCYSTYQEYLESDDWKEKSTKRKEIDGNKCQICLSECDLRVHHKTYKRCLWQTGQCIENIETDLITLCDCCHKKIHDAVKALQYINSDYFIGTMSDFVLRGFIFSEFMDREIMFGGDLNFSDIFTPKKVISSLFPEEFSKYLSAGKIRDFFVELKRKIAKEAYESGKNDKTIMKSLGMTKKAFDGRIYSNDYKNRLFFQQHKYFSDIVLMFEEAINDFNNLKI